MASRKAVVGVGIVVAAAVILLAVPLVPFRHIDLDFVNFGCPVHATCPIPSVAGTESTSCYLFGYGGWVTNMTYHFSDFASQGCALAPSLK